MSKVKKRIWIQDDEEVVLEIEMIEIRPRWFQLVWSVDRNLFTVDIKYILHWHAGTNIANFHRWLSLWICEGSWGGQNQKEPQQHLRLCKQTFCSWTKTEELPKEGEWKRERGYVSVASIANCFKRLFSWKPYTEPLLPSKDSYRTNDTIKWIAAIQIG